MQIIINRAMKYILNIDRDVRIVKVEKRIKLNCSSTLGINPTKLVVFLETSKFDQLSHEM